ncbi:MAG TPA: ATP-binding protein, partial [Hanamia sp.]|nr:ATP-binding protein [Hanamia sp.]
AEALRTLGFSYIRISKHKDALEYLQEALAFYACTERSRSAVNQHASTGSAGQDYQPTVSVSTKKSENSVIITVSDNGTGIPQSIVNKIFQPFFTTKPTGEGTGLGLSLSYDIIKAHGGEIKVESKEGEGSVLVIKLPI